MKLRELKLKNFGKFHDKSIQLQDGINVICGENESGKTTMHTFIRTHCVSGSSMQRRTRHWLRNLRIMRLVII